MSTNYLNKGELSGSATTTPNPEPNSLSSCFGDLALKQKYISATRQGYRDDEFSMHNWMKKMFSPLCVRPNGIWIEPSIAGRRVDSHYNNVRGLTSTSASSGNLQISSNVVDKLSQIPNFDIRLYRGAGVRVHQIPMPAGGKYSIPPVNVFPIYEGDITHDGKRIKVELHISTTKTSLVIPSLGIDIVLESGHQAFDKSNKATPLSGNQFEIITNNFEIIGEPPVSAINSSPWAFKNTTSLSNYSATPTPGKYVGADLTQINIKHIGSLIPFRDKSFKKNGPVYFNNSSEAPYAFYQEYISQDGQKLTIDLVNSGGSPENWETRFKASGLDILLEIAQPSINSTNQNKITQGNQASWYGASGGARGWMQTGKFPNTSYAYNDWRIELNTGKTTTVTGGLEAIDEIFLSHKGDSIASPLIVSQFKGFRTDIIENLGVDLASLDLPENFDFFTDTSLDFYTKTVDSSNNNSNANLPIAQSDFSSIVPNSNHLFRNFKSGVNNTSEDVGANLVSLEHDKDDSGDALLKSYLYNPRVKYNSNFVFSAFLPQDLSEKDYPLFSTYARAEGEQRIDLMYKHTSGLPDGNTGYIELKSGKMKADGDFDTAQTNTLRLDIKLTNALFNRNGDVLTNFYPIIVNSYLNKDSTDEICHLTVNTGEQYYHAQEIWINEVDSEGILVGAKESLDRTEIESLLGGYLGEFHSYGGKTIIPTTLDANKYQYGYLENTDTEASRDKFQAGYYENTSYVIPTNNFNSPNNANLHIFEEANRPIVKIKQTYASTGLIAGQYYEIDRVQITQGNVRIVDMDWPSTGQVHQYINGTDRGTTWEIVEYYSGANDYKFNDGDESKEVEILSTHNVTKDGYIGTDISSNSIELKQGAIVKIIKSAIPANTATFTSDNAGRLVRWIGTDTDGQTYHNLNNGETAIISSVDGNKLRANTSNIEANGITYAFGKGNQNVTWEFVNGETKANIVLAEEREQIIFRKGLSQLGRNGDLAFEWDGVTLEDFAQTWDAQGIANTSGNSYEPRPVYKSTAKAGVLKNARIVWYTGEDNLGGTLDTSNPTWLVAYDESENGYDDSVGSDFSAGSRDITNGSTANPTTGFDVIKGGGYLNISEQGTKWKFRDSKKNVLQRIESEIVSGGSAYTKLKDSNGNVGIFEKSNIKYIESEREDIYSAGFAELMWYAGGKLEVSIPPQIQYSYTCPSGCHVVCDPCFDEISCIEIDAIKHSFSGKGIFTDVNGAKLKPRGIAYASGWLPNPNTKNCIPKTQRYKYQTVLCYENGRPFRGETRERFINASGVEVSDFKNHIGHLECLVIPNQYGEPSNKVLHIDRMGDAGQLLMDNPVSPHYDSNGALVEGTYTAYELALLARDSLFAKEINFGACLGSNPSPTCCEGVVTPPPPNICSHATRHECGPGPMVNITIRLNIAQAIALAETDRTYGGYENSGIITIATSQPADCGYEGPTNNPKGAQNFSATIELEASKLPSKSCVQTGIDNNGDPCGDLPEYYLVHASIRGGCEGMYYEAYSIARHVHITGKVKKIPICNGTVCGKPTVDWCDGDCIVVDPPPCTTPVYDIGDPDSWDGQPLWPNVTKTDENGNTYQQGAGITVDVNGNVVPEINCNSPFGFADGEGGIKEGNYEGNSVGSNTLSTEQTSLLDTALSNQWSNFLDGSK